MIAKLVYNSHFTRTYGRSIELVNGTINQLIPGGAPLCKENISDYCNGLISLHDACSMYLLAELLPFYVEAVKAMPDQHMAVTGLRPEELLVRVNEAHNERRIVYVRSEDASWATDGNWSEVQIAWLEGGLKAILELGRSVKSLGNASFQWHIWCSGSGTVMAIY